MKGERVHEKTDSYAEGFETFSRNNGENNPFHLEDCLDGGFKKSGGSGRMPLVEKSEERTLLK
jgi:hypothetical protein